MLRNQRKALMMHPVVAAYRHFKWYNYKAKAH